MEKKKREKKKNKNKEKDEIKKYMSRGKKKEVPVEFIHTGNTLANLAFSQKGRNGGIPRGRITNPVGDGSSGKSLSALEILAYSYYYLKLKHSSIFPKIINLILVYNNTEVVMDFPIREMYGDKFVDALEQTNLPTVEEVGRDFALRTKKLKEGDCLIYVQDSWDSLKSKESMDNWDESIAKNTEIDSGFNLAKQKYGTQHFFPNICGKMEGKDSTLIIISQTRDRISSKFPGQYRTGGKALDFYTHLVPWLRQAKKLTHTVQGQVIPYGVKVEINVKRSKVSKPYRKTVYTILFDHGVDNIGSMCEYYFGADERIDNLQKLYSTDVYDYFDIDEDKDMEKKAAKREKVDRKQIIEFIENENLEHEMEDLVEKLWLEREEKGKEIRKKRFPGQ